MAIIFADSAGTILRMQLSQTEENLDPNQPAGATVQVLLDETTNVALVADMRDNSSAYTAPGGVLTKAGAPVTVAAAGPAFNERTAIGGLVGKIVAGTALTAPEQALFNRWVARTLLRLSKRL